MEVKRKLKDREVIKERTGRVSGENKNEQGGDKRREMERERGIGRRKIEQKGLVMVRGTCELYKV